MKLYTFTPPPSDYSKPETSVILDLFHWAQGADPLWALLAFAAAMMVTIELTGRIMDHIKPKGFCR